MLQYFKHFKYILKHKYYVMIECFKRGLYWQGLIHDLSKLRPCEFIPYSNNFYNNKGGSKNNSNLSKTGYYRDPDNDNNDFNLAWLSHIHKNFHHWQYWIEVKHDKTIKTYKMPEKYMIEMLCDWIGAGKAQGCNNNTKKWYEENNNKIILHEDTKRWIEEEIDKL